MIKSIFNGLSGVRAHQVQMDAIGSNIANINTVGYKAAQVTFEEAFSLTLRTADGPRGINPTQIGLGSRAKIIKSVFTQGGLQETGNVTDVAIIGSGFFVVNDGTRDYYTRAGNFHLDSDGLLINNQGFRVQGKQANADGVIPPEATIGSISLPSTTQLPAAATTAISLSGNLDASDPILNTITKTRPWLATAEATEDLNGLFANGRSEAFLNLVSGVDTLTIGDQNGTQTFTYGVNFTSIEDLANVITDTFTGRFSAAVGTDGQITFTSLAANITLVAQSNTSIAFNNAFENIDGNILLNTGDTIDSDEFAHIAQSTDVVTLLRNSQGDLLDLAVGDDITLLSTTIGDNTLSNVSLLADITATTTLEELRAALQTSLFGSNPQPEEKVVLKSDGRISIEGALGTENAISGIKIGAGPDPNDDTRSGFAASMSLFEDQAAKDAIHVTTTTVFDQTGEAHTMHITFKKTRDTGKWTWTAGLAGSESVRGGGSGSIRLNRDGSLNFFEFDDGATQFSFDPGNGTDAVKINLFAGTEGDFDGMTQFAAPSTSVAITQDGHALGQLETTNIDENGVISVNFSNGISRTIAQLTLAQFNNPTGLVKAGNSLFSETGSSGSPIIGEAGGSIQAQIASGQLEQSNVDLAEEFTRLIIAQRGFQANSRVITTSSDILNELVNLKQ
ncbi:flagellar hook-basal body complex protein [Candidatus Poribacteria bacterium]|nr:flagellar hook-basal body complex protein [Candidatus Poribacteria bacterium]